MPRTELIQIEPEQIRKFASKKNITLKEMSHRIGRSDDYMKVCLRNGRMSQNSYNFMCAFYRLPIGAFAVSEGNRIEECFSESKKKASGYSIDVEINDTRTRLILRLDGKEIGRGCSDIRGKEEIDIFQSVSYAAHQMFKMKQQEIWNK